MSRLVGSPCCLPGMATEDLFPAYREIGFTKYEAFSTWAAARHEWTGDPRKARDFAAGHGLRITSYHLPQIGEDGNLDAALDAARYASQLGDNVITLFKAATRETFGRTGRAFLDAVADLDITPVLQNHAGSAITTLADFEEVLDRIDDPRMRAILEVGHFRRVGVDWRAGWNLLGGRIALIHVNEIRDGQSVPYGTGGTDFTGLLRHVKATGWTGDIVVELELPTHETNPEITLAGLRDATRQLCALS